jgi:energy-coupling factor transport system ATP-binding protein
MTTPVLSIEDLSVTYARASRPALSHVTLQVGEGEFVGVMGANGAGKSTLALASVGIVPEFYDVSMSGAVTVLGAGTRQVAVEGIALRGAGIVFQQPDMQLISVNVELEVAFAMENHRFPREVIKARITKALRVVRLAGFEHRAPEQLSGGQKQSVCIAVALALEPRLIVLDEPTSQLDPIGSQMVFEALRDINREHNIAILIMEHKAELLARYVDRIAVLDEGQVIYEATPSKVFSHADDLSARGVPVPQVSQLAVRLQRELGVEFDPFPVDDETMARQCADLCQRQLVA